MYLNRILDNIKNLEQNGAASTLELIFNSHKVEAKQAKVLEIDDDLIKNIVLNGDIEDIKSLNEYLKAKNNLERRALPRKNNLAEVRELTELMQSKLTKDED